jgi:adenosylcobinamide-GDP ribazoletransferase
LNIRARLEVFRRLLDPAKQARIVRAARVALGFLTILPARFCERRATDADLASARHAFPVVGLAIGLLLAGLSAAMSYGRIPPMLAAFVLVAAWAALSGGRHLKGLADSGDGLLLEGNAQQRLAAMRTPHVSSYGLLTLVLVVLGKYAVLTVLTDRRRALALLGAAAVSRTMILVASGLAPDAHPGGPGRPIVEATTVIDSLWSVVASLALGAILAGEAGLLASILALVVTWGLTQLATQKLDGLTDEILGAVVELGELAYLVILGLFATL